MSVASKARRLANQLEDEDIELEHIYYLIKHTMNPDDRGLQAYKVTAMRNIKTARDMIEGAMNALRSIK